MYLVKDSQYKQDVSTDLFGESNTTHWYALYTKSRHEKLVDSQLKKRNVESFLPLRRFKRRWSDRIMIVEEPLFKGYLFVKSSLLERRGIITNVKGAVKFVSAGSRPIPMQGKDIMFLKTAIDCDVDLEPYPYLNAGDRVCIKKGPFKNFEGYIIRKNKKNCALVVSIDGIMRSASLKIDASLVEKT